MARITKREVFLCIFMKMQCPDLNAEIPRRLPAFFILSFYSKVDWIKACSLYDVQICLKCHWKYSSLLYNFNTAFPPQTSLNITPIIKVVVFDSLSFNSSFQNKECCCHLDLHNIFYRNPNIFECNILIATDSKIWELISIDTVIKIFSSDVMMHYMFSRCCAAELSMRPRGDLYRMFDFQPVIFSVHHL